MPVRKQSRHMFIYNTYTWFNVNKTDIFKSHAFLMRDILGCFSFIGNPLEILLLFPSLWDFAYRIVYRDTLIDNCVVLLKITKIT